MAGLPASFAFRAAIFKCLLVTYLAALVRHYDAVSSLKGLITSMGLRRPGGRIVER
jgi:hypothetical protein